MTDRALQGHPDISLTVRRSSRARRITLRISQLDGRVTLTLPKGVSEAAAVEFAEQKAEWIRKHLARRVEDVAVGLGQEIPVAGKMRLIVHGTGRSVRLEEDRLCIPGAEAAVPRRVMGYLKTLARDRLAAASDHYASRLGRSYSGISMRDTRSRWGSCSSAGRLMYSWRLVMAAPDVLNYVAAHEVAHLAQMNHSPAFWAEVTKLFGPYQEQRQWLRTEGNALHRYRFGD
ncbi:M48 family metallopeptidase [Tateyamaria pelophila]|uniref:M48 family metallopeptidase n=1 Tax=Tateyamaria pelophila TaxID=328415 RepID=UPI001CC19CA3|nr:SprT family zinc-dependent metalloprotease [Tateyamaria pelophila]